MSDNTAEFYSGGGVFNQGSLTITDSTLSDNFANDSGGGFFNLTDYPLKTTITNSTISGNVAATFGGGGIYNGSGATLNLTDSTVADNVSVNQPAGGIYGFFGSTINVTRSTVSGNVSIYGGGIWSNSDYTTPSLTLNSCTIYGNKAELGGGIHSGGTLVVRNTIIAGNTASSGPNCEGTITSAGYNLDSGNSCLLTGTGDQINTDPLLGVLLDNGGPTSTHALALLSPAVDAGEARKLIGWAGSQEKRAWIVPKTGHTFGAVHPWQGPTPAWERLVDLTASWFENWLG